MPNETLELTQFLGIASKVDAQDLPDGLSPYSKNVDPESPEGRLQAILGLNGLVPTSHVSNSAFIEKEKDLYTLIYGSSSTVKASEDFYGSPSINDLDSNTVVATNLIGHNKEVRIPTGHTAPKWCGYVKPSPFNGVTTFTPAVVTSGLPGTNNLGIDQNGYHGSDTFTVQITEISYTTSWLEMFIGFIRDGKIILSGHNGTTDQPHTCIAPEHIGLNITVTHALTTSVGVYKIVSIPDEYTLEVEYVSGGHLSFPDPLSPDTLFWLSLTELPTTTIADMHIKWKKNTGAYSASLLMTETFTLGADIKIYFKTIVDTHRVGDTWVMAYSSLSPSLILTDAELKNYKSNMCSDTVTDDPVIVMTIVPGTTVTEAEALFLTKKYYYAYSFVYDNFQNTPLVMRNDGFNPTTYTIPVTTYYDKLNVNVELAYSNYPKRVTGIKIWRAEGDSTSIEPSTKYRLIASSDFFNWNIGSRTGYTHSYNWDITDQNNPGPMYETFCEMPEEVDSSIVNYTIGTIVNGKLAVADCTTPYFDDATKMIFFSKNGQLDTFDASHDFVKLSFVPKVLASFAGKLYAFGNSQIAKINPEGMYVEDTAIGYGIYDSNSILTTEWGIYWCDKNGAYFNNGSTTSILTDLINGKIYSGDKEWKDLFNASDSYNHIRIVYSTEKRSILFFNTATSDCWTYHLPSKQWFYWNFATTSVTSDTHAFTGKDGEVYFTTNGQWYRLFASESYLALVWKSKKIKFNDGLQPKNFYSISMNGNCTLYYGTGIGYTGNPSQSQVSGKIPVTDRRSTEIQIMVIAIAGTGKYFVDNLSLRYRRLNIQ